MKSRPRKKLKRAPESKGEKKESIDYCSDTMRRVYQNFIGFATLKDTASLANVCKAFAAETKKDSTWRNRYESDVGTVFSRQDYKEQCQANHYSKSLSHFFGMSYFPKLSPHVEKHSEAPWVSYYKALICQHTSHGDKLRVAQEALAALEAGDTRASGLLVYHYEKQLENNRLIRLPELNQFLLWLGRQENPDKTLQQRLCYMHCMHYHTSDVNKDNLKKIALNHFFSLVKMADTDVKSFMKFVAKTFFALGLFDRATAQSFPEDKAIGKLPNCLEVMMHAKVVDPMHLDAIARSRVMEFFKQLLQVPTKELQAMAVQFCKTKHWQQNIFKILTMQLCATSENSPTIVQQTLQKASGRLENATPNVRCALTFIFLAQQNLIAAREQFDLAVIADHQAFTHYLQASMNFDVDQSQYRGILNEFMQHEPARKKRKFAR